MKRNRSAGATQTHSDRTGPSRTSEQNDPGRLVLDVVRGTPGHDFLIRRARREVEGLSPGPERRVLSRVLDTVESAPAGTPSECVLLEWVGHLERRGRLEDAARVLDLAREVRRDGAELALHRARISRKAGEADRAAALYRRVRELDGERGRLARMARVGLALLSRDPEQQLGRNLRRSLADGDEEAAAVAQESRARVRRRQGDVEGALRDYAIAAIRFRDPADRGRIAHEAADLLLTAGEPLAARRVLRTAVATARPEQAERARSRLRTLSRRLGDQVGARRWGAARIPPDCDPCSVAEQTLRADGGLHERLQRWLSRLETPESER